MSARPTNALHDVANGINTVVGAPGKAMDALNAGFASATSAIANVLPAFPAATLGSIAFGAPHAHAAHPPSGPPPVPPTPLPPIGPVMLGVCIQVLINGKPAARSGDIGLSPTCCGLPVGMYEVKTGSSKVFIGGARAARMTDFSHHCTPAASGAAARASRAAAVASKVSKMMSMAGKVAQGLSIAGDAVEAVEADNAAMSAALGLNAAMMAAQAAADAAAQAAAAAMGKDQPMIPPTGTLGAILANTSPNVQIGGFPMPSWQAIAQGLMKAFKALKARAKAKKQNSKCDRPGHPVNPVSGSAANEFLDFEDARFGFRWERYFDTDWCNQDGPLGFAFRHSFQHELHVTEGLALYRSPEGVEFEFEQDERGNFPEPLLGYRLRRAAENSFVLTHPAVGRIVFDRLPKHPSATRPVSIERASYAAYYEYSPGGALRTLREELRGGEKLRACLTHFQYDAAGRMVRLSRGAPAADPAEIVRYEYDKAGCLSAWVDGLGARGSYAYDRNRRVLSETDRNGFKFTYRYDEHGRCIESVGQDGLWRVQLAYEAGYTTVTESDGGKWQFIHDHNGTITKIVDPYGGVRTRQTAEDGRVIADIDTGGRRVEWLYTGDGWNYGRRDRFGNFLPPADEMPNPPNPLAHEVPFDPWTQQVGIRAVAAGSALIAPPAEVRRALHEAAQPAITQRQSIQKFDAAGRLIEEIDADSRVRRFHYDAEGNLAVEVDADKVQRKLQTTSWNLLGREQDASGGSTTYTYTPHEEIASITDALGGRSEYEYDHRDRLVCVRRHGRVRESYRYDHGDRLLEKRDGSGNLLLSFEVGPNGLHSVRRLSEGGEQTFAYDGAGNIIAAGAPGAAVKQEWGALRRRLKDECNGRGVEHAYVGGELRSSKYLKKFEVRYAPRPDGSRMVIAPAGGVNRFACDSAGRLARELGNGTCGLDSYDRDGRCTGRSAWRDGARPWHVRYEYSPGGDLRRAVDSQRGATQFEYDAAHKLIAARTDGGAQRAWQYDRAGNILVSPRHAALRYEEGNRIQSADGERFEHNLRNHVARRRGPAGEVRYAYNSLDMLVGIEWSDGRPAWKAGYDALGRRVWKQVGEARTEFIWDGDRLAAELAPDGRLRLYVYASEDALVPFQFIDYAGVDAEPESGTAYFVHVDQIGLPLRVEDATGQIVWEAASVDPYGLIEVAPGATVEYNLRWPGHYFDAETGLHYNRFRYYSPELGRYLQSDPLGQAGGINLYAYSRNPLSEVDVLGLNHDGKNKTGADQGNGSTGPSAESAADKMKKRRQQQKEDRRQKALNEAIAKADAKGEFDSLSQADKDFLNEDPRHKQLAIDLDGDGGYRPDEARTALQAEKDNPDMAPMRRATKQADPGEAGADFVSGKDDKQWDVKDASMGADNIADGAAPPRGDKENILVDGRNVDQAQREQLRQDVANKNQGKDSGDVVVVPKD